MHLKWFYRYLGSYTKPLCYDYARWRVFKEPLQISLRQKVIIDELIKEITDEYNITTIVITHDMNSVMGIGDYIMFMYKGQKVWEGASKNIMDTQVPELQEFLYANQLIKAMKK